MYASQFPHGDHARSPTPPDSSEKSAVRTFPVSASTMSNLARWFTTAIKGDSGLGTISSTRPNTAGGTHRRRLRKSPSSEWISMSSSPEASVTIATRRPSQRYRPSLHLGCAPCVVTRSRSCAAPGGASSGGIEPATSTFGSCSLTGAYSSAGPSHRPMENIRPRTLARIVKPSGWMLQPST